jgi:hypothetical protein
MVVPNSGAIGCDSISPHLPPAPPPLSVAGRTLGFQSPDRSSPSERADQVVGLARSGGGYIEQHRRAFRVAWVTGGRRHRRSFPSEEEARAFLQRLNQERDSTPRTRGALTVGEVVDNWYRGHRRNLSSGTRRDYEGRIRRDVGWIGGILAEDLEEPT